MSLKFTEENFESEVLNNTGLSIVDFYADWCGPCKMMAPIIDELFEEYKDTVKIGKVNVDECPGVSQKYRVMSIPTILFIKNGEVVDTTVGALTKAALVEKIEQFK